MTNTDYTVRAGVQIAAYCVAFSGLLPSSLPAGKPASSTVVLTDESVDESAGSLPAFKIETPSATYYLEKTGGGLSSLVDGDGKDWIGFHPEKGSGASGEYRGFPNAVHKQAGNHFHPKNEMTVFGFGREDSRAKASGR